MEHEKALVAIVGIALLSAWALYLGYDGVLFLTTIGIMAGLGGYPILQELKDRWDAGIVQGSRKVKRN